MNVKAKSKPLFLRQAINQATPVCDHHSQNLDMKPKTTTSHHAVEPYDSPPNTQTNKQAHLNIHTVFFWWRAIMTLILKEEISEGED